MRRSYTDPRLKSSLKGCLFPKEQYFFNNQITFDETIHLMVLCNNIFAVPYWTFVYSCYGFTLLKFLRWWIIIWKLLWRWEKHCSSYKIQIIIIKEKKRLTIKNFKIKIKHFLIAKKKPEGFDFVSLFFVWRLSRFCNK